MFGRNTLGAWRFGLLSLSVAQLVSAQTPAEILKATGIHSGLAAIIGSGDGNLETSLTSGSLLVQSLSTDAKRVAAARVALAKAGKFPLGNATWVPDYKQLPFADNLLNLVVADLDAMGSTGPSEDEILRVLAFEGKGYVKHGGSWKVLTNPTPKDVDDWPFPFYDAQRRPFSNDMRVQPWNSLKWIAGPTTRGLSNGVRVQGGQVYFMRALRVEGNSKNTNLPKGTPMLNLLARDAHNGTLLWRRPIATYADSRGATKTMNTGFVAHDGKVFFYPAGGGYLTAYDGRTGEVVQEYRKTTFAPAEVVGRSKLDYPVNLSVIFFRDGKMVQTYKNNIWLLDEKSGDVIWHHKEQNDSNWIYQATLGDDGDIYAGITLKGPWSGYKDNTTGHMAWLKGYVRIAFKDGKIVWRNETDLVGAMGHTLGGPGEGIVPTILQVSYGRKPECNKHDGLAIYAFSMADGKKLWNFCTPTNHTSVAVSIRESKVWVTDLQRINYHDPKNGSELGRWRLGEGNPENPGCMSLAFTPRFITQGPKVIPMPTSLGGGKSTLRDEIAMCFRPNCGEIVVPAYGQVYSPGTGCGCSWYLPGDLAAYRADSLPWWKNDNRLHKGDDGLGEARVEGAVQSFSDSSSLREDWLMAVDYLNGSKASRWGAASLTRANPPKAWNTRTETDIVTVGDLSLRSIIHENRIEARRGNQVVWTYLTGGRVSVAPVIVNGFAIFGSHDGWVYALKVADGSLAWRYFAAPADRRVVAYGQVESSWPLYGVLSADGKIYYMAGRSSSIDNGLFAGALDPATGASQWRIRVARYDFAKYGHYINTPLTAVDGKIAFLGPSINPAAPADIINGTPGTVSLVGQDGKARRRAAVTAATEAGQGKLYDLQGRVVQDFKSNKELDRGMKRILAPGHYLFYPADEESADPAMLYKNGFR